MHELDPLQAKEILRRLLEEKQARNADFRRSMESRRRAEIIGLWGMSFGQVFVGMILLLPTRVSPLNSSSLDFAAFFGLNLLWFPFATVPMGVCCAWLAHFWFDRSSISVTRMTIVLAAIVDLTIVGWLLVIRYCQ